MNNSGAFYNQEANFIQLKIVKIQVLYWKYLPVSIYRR